MTDQDLDLELAVRLAYARERVLLDEIASLTATSSQLNRRVSQLEAQFKQRYTTLEKRQRADVKRLDRKIAAKRFDKQIVGLLRSAKRRSAALRRSVDPRHVHVLVVCPAYPGGDRRYGGEFVRARVRLYRAAGATVTVVVVPSGPTRRERYEHEGVTVIRVDASRLAATITAKQPDVVAVHHLTPEVWSELRTTLATYPAVAWVHGYEARDWRELEFNYSRQEIEDRRKTLDALNDTRRAALTQAFGDERVRFVFVSKFMRGVAESFVGRAPVDGRVIPNVIDEARFPYAVKAPELRYRVLWVRSFSAHNYANDLARDAILELAQREGFEQYSFTIVGDGRDFDEITAPLRVLPNVQVSKGFVSSQELRALHADHGVMLVPTRWDSQGLTCGEAMSSGLVPVTNRVAAIPEFVDEDSGLLCPPEDAGALADAIERLGDDPKMFARMSMEAARTSQAKCGRDATTELELELLRVHARSRV